MRLKYLRLAGLIGLTLILGGVGLPSVMGQGMGGSTSGAPGNPFQAGQQTAAAPAPQPASKIIPEINVQNTRIEDLVDYLREQDPNFKVIVTRDPADSQAPLVSLRLKNVTGPDVLQMLQAAYPYQAPTNAGGVMWPPPSTTVSVQGIAGEGGETLYAVKINVPAGAMQPLTPQEANEHRQQQQIVMVYNLRPMVRALVLSQRDPTAPATEPANFDAAYHKAMNDTLSLIKAVLDMMPAHTSPNADIRVHVETGTLIIRGTQDQQEVISRAMRALENQGAPVVPNSQGWRGPGNAPAPR